MIEFGGIQYYLDLGEFEKLIRLNDVSTESNICESVTKTYIDESGKVSSSEVIETDRERAAEIDSTKHELVRNLIDIVLDDIDEENDDTLGVDRVLEKRPLSYKIAFNTLIHYGILKEHQ